MGEWVRWAGGWIGCVSRQVGEWFGWLVCCWLVCWLVSRLVGWFFGLSVGRLVGRHLPTLCGPST